MNIYSGEFSLRKTHCLNPDSQDLGIFPINSEKKQRILHNFTNVLAKNIKTPSKSTLAPIKNIGGWAKNIKAPLKNIGALIKNIRPLTKNIKALLKNIGALTKNIKALLKNIGALTKNIRALIKNIGIIVRTPIHRIKGLTRLQIYMHNVGVRFIAPCGGALHGNISLQGVINHAPTSKHHRKTFQHHTNFTLTPNKENHNENKTQSCSR